MPLTILLPFVIVLVESAFPYPIYNDNSHFSISENFLDSSEIEDRRFPQINKVLPCQVEDISKSISLEDLQFLVEEFAASNEINPFLVLRKLNRRIRNREEAEETMNSVDGPPASEIPHQPIMDLPPSKLSPETSGAPYSVSPHTGVIEVEDDGTEVVIIPVDPSPLNRTPNTLKTEHKMRQENSFAANSVNPVAGRLSNMLPGTFLSPVKNNQLKAPLGAIIHVNSGDPLRPVNRDITVTVSPLMTLIEALREAEIKYQNILGLSHDAEIFTFTHSAILDCYMLKSINDIVKTEDSGWKVTIKNRDGQVVYDSFCLPSGKEILVKPGTEVSLTYVPL